MLKNTKLGNDQQGFASIVIGLIFIIVLGLITVGFAQLARREQQNSLDKQLATQASYSAETGINDVYNSVYGPDQAAWTQLATTGTPNSTLNDISKPDPNTCLDSAQISEITGSSSGGTINNTVGAAYSCVLLDLTPTTLSGDQTALTSDNIPFSSADGNPLSSLTIYWQSEDGHDKYPTTSPTDFNPNGDWDPSAVGTNDQGPLLQFSLSVVPTAGVSRAGLINSTYTAYLYPDSANSCPIAGGGSPGCSYASVVGPGTTSQAPILDGDCQTDHSDGRLDDCEATITNLPITGVKSYDANIVGFYDSYHFDMDGTSVTTTGAQAPSTYLGEIDIDVTGKDRNVLKRIREVVKPETGNDSGNPLSSEAIEGENVCKRQQTAPVSSINPNGTTYVGPSGSDPAACDLSTNN